MKHLSTVIAAMLLCALCLVSCEFSISGTVTEGSTGTSALTLGTSPSSDPDTETKPADTDAPAQTEPPVTEPPVTEPADEPEPDPSALIGAAQLYTEPEDEGIRVTIFTNETSDLYKGLGETIRLPATPENPEAQKTVRFVCSADAKVSLDIIGWDGAVEGFRRDGKVFEIDAKANTAYEFAAAFAETIPYYRLTAQREMDFAHWELVLDGADSASVFEINSFLNPDEVPDVYEKIYTLARIHAKTSAYGRGDAAEMPEYFWNAIAESVSLILDGQQDNEGCHRLSEFAVECYSVALYPSFGEYPHIQDWDAVNFDEESKTYEFLHLNSDINTKTKVSNAYRVLNGGLVIAVSVDMPDGSVVDEHVFCWPDTNPNNPFGWVIFSSEIPEAMG